MGEGLANDVYSFFNYIERHEIANTTRVLEQFKIKQKRAILHLYIFT